MAFNIARSLFFPANDPLKIRLLFRILTKMIHLSFPLHHFQHHLGRYLCPFFQNDILVSHRYKISFYYYQFLRFWLLVWNHSVPRLPEFSMCQEQELGYIQISNQINCTQQKIRVKTCLFLGEYLSHKLSACGGKHFH